MDLTTYISNLKCGDLSVITQQGDCVISGNSIKAFLNKLPQKVTQGQIYIRMIKLNNDPFLDIPVSNSITIILDASNPPYYKVTVSNPSYNLDKWTKTFIVIFGYNCITYPRIWAGPEIRTSGIGAIPLLKSDVVTPKGPFTYPLITNNILPGEKVCAQWEFYDGEDSHVLTCDDSGVYWKTLYISGGYIISQHGNYEDTDLSFTVNIEGIDQVCYPSDYMRWKTGDWVFVASLGVRKYIIPIKINNKAVNWSSNIKNYAAGEMDDLLNTEFITLTIVSVDAQNNRAELHALPSNLTDIDIFYHVPDGNTVSIDAGGQAFNINDQVIVFKCGAEYKIIGFTDGLHPASKLRLLFAIEGINLDIYYLPDDSEMYVLDFDNLRIIKTNLAGANQTYWIPRADLGNGQHYLMVQSDLSNLEIASTTGNIYFMGTHDFLPCITAWEELFFYGGSYDEQTYPVILYPVSTLTKNYRIRFDSTVDFKCYDLDDNSVVGTGDINTDFTTDYFKFNHEGWIGSFGNGDMIDFSTAAAGESEFDGIFINTFNKNTDYLFINLTGFYSRRFHYCNSNNFLYVLLTQFDNGVFNLLLRKYGESLNYEERTVISGVSSPAIDFCHDCENDEFYISYSGHILKYSWGESALTDWEPSFSNPSYIALNTGLSKLYVTSEIIGEIPTIYKCSFGASQYDEIISDALSPAGLKFLNDILFIINFDGKIYQYKE